MEYVQDHEGASLALEPSSGVAVVGSRDVQTPLVSVCIVNWNCREVLRNCLSSLLHQSQGVRFEIIVVDNGSRDGAADMVAREFTQVILIRNAENRGFSRANNQAAEVARGRYLFFLNNDTLIPSGTLRRLTQYLQEHPQVGMVGPRLRGPGGEYQISYRRRPTLAALMHRISLVRWTGLYRRAYADYRRETFSPEGIRPVEVLMGAAVMLPREVFQACGGWDERYRFGGEDLDLSTQVGRIRPLVYVGTIEVVHLGRVASRKNVGFAAPNVAIGYVHYFRKSGAHARQLLVYKLLVTLDAPLQLLGKLSQGLVRQLRGDRGKAGKSWESARGASQFLCRELVRFWKA